MNKAKDFDCVEMKRKAQEKVRQNTPAFLIKKRIVFRGRPRLVTPYSVHP